MSMHPITIRIRRGLYPTAIGLALLGSSSFAVAQTDVPATAASTPMASEPMTMEHGAAMHGKAQAAAGKGMHKKSSQKSMSHDGMMKTPGKPSKKQADMGAMQNMAGMDMKHEQGASKAPPIGSLPTSDGAAPKGYDAYGIALRVHDDPLLAKLQIDSLESAYSSDGANSQYWDGRFWVGHNLDKLWIRSEGSRSKGRIEEGDVEALWGHAISPFWNLMAGVRHDLGIGPTRNWAAFGFQGIAPYEFEFEATVYAGPSGRSAFRLKTAQDWFYTQKLILTPELDINAYSRADPRRGLGAGVSNASLTFRLRYEFSRKLAPYIGYSWVHKFGPTAGMARAGGRPVTDRQILMGVRVWF